MTPITDYDRKFLTDLGARLKARRICLHLSCRQLARMTGVSHVTIWRVERAGSHTASLLTVMRLMAAMPMSPGETLPPFQPDGWSRTTLAEAFGVKPGENHRYERN